MEFPCITHHSAAPESTGTTLTLTPSPVAVTSMEDIPDHLIYSQSHMTSLHHDIVICDMIKCVNDTLWYDKLLRTLKSCGGWWVDEISGSGIEL